MSCDVFISWSKDRSLKVAKALKTLIGGVMQVRRHADKAPDGEIEEVDLARLSEDLPKGGNWFSDLAGELENSGVGIICVTPENKASPWLLFEAGALLRCDRDVKLFPVLLDLEPGALDPPLSLLQSTVLSRDPKELVREIQDLLRRIGEHLNGFLQQDFSRAQALYEQERKGKSRKSGTDQPKLRWISVIPAPECDRDPNDTGLAKCWQAFCDAIARIEPAGIETIVCDFTSLFDRKTFREPFDHCTDQRWLDRYAATTLAKHRLEQCRPAALAALPGGGRVAYMRLQSAVDSYAMTLAGQLLDERRFERNSEGRLQDREGRLAVSERRRRDIEKRYLQLCDPIPPVFDDARVYDELKDLRERKIRLIHPMEYRFEAEASANAGGHGPMPTWRLDKAKVSAWLYDRLVYYVYARFFPKSITSGDLLNSIERECQIIEAADEPQSLVGTYYLLETIDLRKAAADVDESEISDVLGRICDVINRWRQPFEEARQPGLGPDANGQVRNLAKRLQSQVMPSSA
jgi:hypothetical protein